MQTVYSLFYCNPHDFVGNFRTLEDALAIRDKNYCQYIVERKVSPEDKVLSNRVVWSTARDNPKFKVGYSW